MDNLSNIGLARALMRGEPSQFKAGYTAENAVLAVQSLRGLSDEATRELLISVKGSE